MKIPDKIQIAGLIFSVEITTGLKETDDCIGFSDFQTQVIKLNAEDHPQSLELSFIHELVHIIQIILGYKNVNDKVAHDEVYINSFSTLWHQVVVQLVEYQIKKE